MEDGDGGSLWESAVCFLMPLKGSASTITALLDRGFGADFVTVDRRGWNTLFHLVLCAEAPDSGEELEAVRVLLPVFGNVLTVDRDGHTLFDRIGHERPALPDSELDLSTYSESFRHYGSYQQDLLYCAILRNGPASLHDLPPLPAGPRFNWSYTPQHYRALLYLQTWDEEADPTVLTHPLLNKDRLLDGERERAPAFREWKISDLLMMERRLEHATFAGRVQECSSSDEGTDTSASDESDDLDSNRSVHLAEGDSEESEGGWGTFGRRRPWGIRGWRNVPVKEEEVLGGSRNDWSDDSEEEGGVPVRL
jgi:hypothetical protein